MKGAIDMQRALLAVTLAAGLLVWSRAAHGQQTTEQFIPVGQSPGISGIRSYTGEIEAVDVGRKTITVRGPEGPRTIKLAVGTRIWLDRTVQRLTNTAGTMADLRAGRRVEVKYVDDRAKATADWIKVVVPAGG
jgi:hypothetical protein